MSYYNTVNTDYTDNTVPRCVLKQCVYKQIVEDIKRRCELGIFEEGGKLPSCRELAISLGVNPNTVQRAYSELEQDGYVISSPKKGYFAKPRGDADKHNVALSKIKELLAAGLTRNDIMNIIDEILGDGND